MKTLKVVSRNRDGNIRTIPVIRRVIRAYEERSGECGTFSGGKIYDPVNNQGLLPAAVGDVFQLRRFFAARLRRSKDIELTVDITPVESIGWGIMYFSYKYKTENIRTIRKAYFGIADLEQKFRG